MASVLIVAMNFNWKEKIEFLRQNPRHNNADGAQVVARENANWTAAIYQLTDEEKPFLNTLFIEVLCKQNEREVFRAVNWGWDGMSAQEKNSIGAIFPDKPTNEIKTHPIMAGQSIWLEVAGGDTVKSLYNGSYLVLFQEVGELQPSPGPDPDPQPPNPDPEKTAVLLISKSWFDSLTPDDDGYVRVYLEQ